MVTNRDFTHADELRNVENIAGYRTGQRNGGKLARACQRGGYSSNHSLR